MSGKVHSLRLEAYCDGHCGVYVCPGEGATSVNGVKGDHPLSDIVAHGLDVFNVEIDAKVRDLYELGSFRNSIASYWLLEVHGLLLQARDAGAAVHHGRSLNEVEVLAYIDSVLAMELSRVRRE